MRLWKVTKSNRINNKTYLLQNKCSKGLFFQKTVHTLRQKAGKFSKGIRHNLPLRFVPHRNRPDNRWCYKFWSANADPPTGSAYRWLGYRWSDSTYIPLFCADALAHGNTENTIRRSVSQKPFRQNTNRFTNLWPSAERQACRRALQVVRPRQIRTVGMVHYRSVFRFQVLSNTLERNGRSCRITVARTFNRLPTAKRIMVNIGRKTYR